MKCWSPLKNCVVITLLLCFIPVHAAGQDTLLIIHPTAGNIKLLDRLITEGIFPLKDPACLTPPFSTSTPAATRSVLSKPSGEPVHSIFTGITGGTLAAVLMQKG